MSFFCQWHLLMISCAMLSTTRSTRIFVDDFRYVLNLNAFNSITDDQFSNRTHCDERLHYTALNALKMSLKKYIAYILIDYPLK